MSLQFDKIEIIGGRFFGIYETLDDDQALVRPVAVTTNIDDANLVYQAINRCHYFAPSHDADLSIEPPITMETLEARFVAAIDQLMHFRIYEVPDETKKSPRLIAFAWDEDDASFMTRSLNQCCDVSSRGYICAPIDWQSIQ